MVLVLVSVGDGALGENGHAAAFVVGWEREAETGAAELCWELSQERNWLGGGPRRGRT